MNPEAERLVRESWEKIEPAADALSSAFYDRLFQIDPEVRAKFSAVDMEQQRKKFMDMLSEVIRVLDEPERLVSELADAGSRHVNYGANRRGYESVGAALIWSLEKELGTDFDSATRDAWRELYGVVSGVMRRSGDRLQHAQGPAPA